MNAPPDDDDDDGGDGDGGGVDVDELVGVWVCSEVVGVDETTVIMPTKARSTTRRMFRHMVDGVDGFDDLDGLDDDLFFMFIPPLFFSVQKLRVQLRTAESLAGRCDNNSKAALLLLLL